MPIVTESQVQEKFEKLMPNMIIIEMKRKSALECQVGQVGCAPEAQLPWSWKNFGHFLWQIWQLHQRRSLL